jgi:hypothetical protein
MAFNRPPSHICTGTGPTPATSNCHAGQGEPSPGTGPTPATSNCHAGQGEPSPGADVAGVSMPARESARERLWLSVRGASLHASEGSVARRGPQRHALALAEPADAGPRLTGEHLPEQADAEPRERVVALQGPPNRRQAGGGHVRQHVNRPAVSPGADVAAASPVLVPMWQG